MKSFTISQVLAMASLASAIPRRHGDGTHFSGASGTKCINFDSSIEWYYQLQGVWGAASGTVAPGPTSVCVPTSPTGGAMYIGEEPTPNDKSTKLECTFPMSGSSEQADCDVSLVNGYSLPVACTLSGASEVAGGSIDLFSVSTCSTQSGVNCVNENGPTTPQSGVAQFFQPATESGNNFCIWTNCSQTINFPNTGAVTCTVYTATPPTQT